MVYPARYGREWLAEFECEYFNTGEEWLVHDSDTAPESPEDIDGYTVYLHEWRDEEKRAELADAIGCAPEDLIMYAYAGERRSAVYREV